MSFAPSGSAAPSSSPQGPGAPQPQGGTPASEGGSDFFKTQFESTKAELARTKQGMQKLNSDFDMLRRSKEESDGQWGKLKDVFAPEAPREADPVKEYEAEMDQVIEAAIEAERNGRPIPMTARAHLAALTARIEQAKFMKEARDEIAALKAQNQRLSDPRQTVYNQAYATMDSLVQQGLDSIYGGAPEYGQVKASQFDSVTKQMATYIQKLRQASPDKWERLARDPQQMQSFVQHHLRQNLPPKAVELLERDNLQNTEQSTGELWAAFRETQKIQDPTERRRVQTRIREDIVARMAGPQKRQQRG